MAAEVTVPDRYAMGKTVGNGVNVTARPCSPST